MDGFDFIRITNSPRNLFRRSAPPWCKWLNIFNCNAITAVAAFFPASTPG